MMLLNLPPTVFNSTVDAEQAAKLMELKHNEYKVVVDPTGTGKCIVVVMDPLDGFEIGKI